MEDGHVLYVGNSSTVVVKGKETIKMEFSSGKILTLKDVYYVLEMRKNLVSSSLLNKYEFNLIFESDKFVQTKKDNFVANEYLSEGMFKLDINN